MFKELFVITEAMKVTQYYFTKDNWEEAAKVAEDVTPNSYPLKYSKKAQTIDIPQGIEQKFEKALDKKNIPFDLNEGLKTAKKGDVFKKKRGTGAVDFVAVKKETNGIWVVYRDQKGKEHEVALNVFRGSYDTTGYQFG